MADRELVIKIPEEKYNYVKKQVAEGIDNPLKVYIANGTLLPKGHGRLGDLDKIKKEMQNYYDDCAKTSEYTRLGFETAIAVIEDAKTIIEADRSDT